MGLAVELSVRQSELPSTGGLWKAFADRPIDKHLKQTELVYATSAAVCQTQLTY